VYLQLECLCACCCDASCYAAAMALEMNADHRATQTQLWVLSDIMMLCNVSSLDVCLPRQTTCMPTATTSQPHSLVPSRMARSTDTQTGLGWVASSHQVCVIPSCINLGMVKLIHTRQHLLVLQAICEEGVAHLHCPCLPLLDR
jgi:hypothetical protein